MNQCNGKYLLASMKGKYIYCNIAPAIKTLNNSIYIIHGKSEKRADENAALYSALNPSIECEMISHAKHFPHIETPKKILEAIDIFFA